MGKYTLINNETGVIESENFQIDNLDDIQRKKKAIQKQKEHTEFQQIQQEICGNFVFFIFKNIDKLQKVLNDNDLVKFVYIGTYVKNNGALMEDNNITYLNKKSLQIKLGLGRKGFSNFYNKIIENKLIKEENKQIYINLNYFYRGKESDYKKLTNKKFKEYTRIYINTTRELFTQTPTRTQKKLVVVYKLLPYVNWKYNILCKKPEEIEKEKIEPLTVGDVIEILGYDRTHITRFKKDFYGLKYNNYNVFKTVQGDIDYNKSTIAVNPLLYYKGYDIDEFKGLAIHFGIK